MNTCTISTYDSELVGEVGSRRSEVIEPSSDLLSGRGSVGAESMNKRNDIQAQ